METRQRCPLSLFLFNVHIRHAVNQEREKGIIIRKDYATIYNDMFIFIENLKTTTNHFRNNEVSKVAG